MTGAAKRRVAKKKGGRISSGMMFFFFGRELILFLGTTTCQTKCHICHAKRPSAAAATQDARRKTKNNKFHRVATLPEATKNGRWIEIHG